MGNSSVSVGGKCKGFVARFFGLLFLLFVAFALAGCDTNVLEFAADDDSYEARIEEALIALDDEDYAKAIDLLEKLRTDFPGKIEVLRYLSNAYAGLAGLNTFNLLETIDLLDDKNSEGNIDMVGLVLVGADGILSNTEITSKKASLESAISALTSISNPSEDERVQLGLLSLNHAALTVAEIVMEDLNNNLNVGEAEITEITLTEAGFDALYPDSATNPPDFATGATSERLESLSADIFRVDDSVAALSNLTAADESNDLSDSSDEFLKEIDPDGNVSISQEELQNYVATL